MHCHTLCIGQALPSTGQSIGECEEGLSQLSVSCRVAAATVGACSGCHSEQRCPSHSSSQLCTHSPSNLRGPLAWLLAKHDAGGNHSSCPVLWCWQNKQHRHSIHTAYTQCSSSNRNNSSNSIQSTNSHTQSMCSYLSIAMHVGVAGVQQCAAVILLKEVDCSNCTRCC